MWKRLLKVLIACLLVSVTATALAQKKIPPVVKTPQIVEAVRLNTQGMELFEAGDYEGAARAHSRALELFEKALGPDHLAVGNSLNRLGAIARVRGEYARAEGLHRRAIAVIERAEGPDSWRLTDPLNNLALLYRLNGGYVHAAPLLERIVTVEEKSVGPNRANNLVVALNNLAWAYRAQAEYARALTLYERALSIVEEALRADDGFPKPLLATVLDNLAQLLFARGEYARAEPLYERALSIRETSLGPRDPAVATTLSNLALLYKTKGDFTRAEPLFLRAVSINETSPRADASELAASLSNLATLYAATGEPGRAVPLLQRALVIWEKTLGPKHPDVATSLNNLAEIYRTVGDYERAEPLLLRAMNINEAALGPEHPLVVGSLSNLALVYVARHNYAGAEPLLQRALATREKVLGVEHPQVAATLYSLALLSWARRDLAHAAGYLSRSLDLQERHISKVLASGSEEQRRLFLATAVSEVHIAVSMHAQGAPSDSTLRSVALLNVLRRKGRLLDVMSDTVRTLRAHLSAEDRELFARLATLRTETASRTLQLLRAEAAFSEQREALAELEREADTIEKQIALRSAEFRVASEPVTLAGVARNIPADSVLIEIVQYSPLDVQAIAWSPPRYAAYALRRTGEIGYADLGPTGPIDELASRLRAALADRNSDPRAIARELDEKLGRPLRTLVGESPRVLLAPDGPLHLVPFAALVDERGEYLIRRYSFTYLTTGRELNNVGRAATPSSPPLVMANPDFGPPGPAAPLPATAEEGHVLAKLLAGSRLLEGSAATKQAVQEVRSPRILHIATHGFFLEQKPGAAPQPDARALVLDVENVTRVQPVAANPLLQAGLVFAGFNAHQAESKLTALEASGLDLWGTKLVVLSACETGLGAVKRGEGVYGMRRAFSLAGAESQVMSLWKVDDEATRDLMTSYYSALQKGGGRTESLREAQLQLLATKARAHPFFWASFIASGNWYSLEGVDVNVRAAPPASQQFAKVRPSGCGCTLAESKVGRSGEWGATAFVLAAAALARRRFAR